ncbi:hypothetical protein ES702_04774 [subsurface metagenome]
MGFGPPIQTLSPDSETVPAGYYEATTLSAVDADLAAANIKNGITIFGIVGTLPATLAEDLKAIYQSAITSTTSGFSWYYREYLIAAAGDYTIVTQTPTFDADSMAVGAVISFLYDNAVSGDLKLQFHMGGVQVAESPVIDDSWNTIQTLIATRALAGAQVCKLAVHNYSGGNRNIRVMGLANGDPFMTFMAIGSIKLT